MIRFFPAVVILTVLAAEPRLTYPTTRRIDHVDTYHGVKVADPYRWLEEDVRKSKDVAAWVEAENRVTFSYLKQIPERETIHRRLTKLWNYERYTPPMKVAGKYYFSKNNGLQNQSVLYVMDQIGGEPRVVLDPNTWSKDGTVALGLFAFSDDGKYLAYSRQEAGSDWKTWHVLDLGAAKTLPDLLHWAKYGSASWTRDGKGFFYDRYPEPKGGGQYHGLSQNGMIYYHRLGTPEAEDVLVYRRPDHPDWAIGAEVTEDGRYLILDISKGAGKNRISYRDLTEPYGFPVDLIDNFNSEYNFIGNDGPIFYFKTDDQAPHGQIVAIDTRYPKDQWKEKGQWKEIIPQSGDTLQSVNLVGNLFICEYLHDAHTQVKLYTVAGEFLRDIAFPGLGSATGFGGKRTDTETFYAFSSFATPPSIYRYDLLTGKTALLRQAKVDFDPNGYEVRQVFYRSKDSTRIPMFLTMKKGTQLNSETPTLLYGYGGFNIPLTPRFSIPYVMWLEMGGIFAQANLRGGGEYGEFWHMAGTKLHKQNVFDDFLAAAQWLVENKYTRPDKLAIQGGSNGGLLVGAAMTQRPDLFGACLPAVGVMDMLRFQRFTAGRFWIDDYGSSDNPEEFKALRAYSPYHNIKDGVHYPATLVTTADTDDRVVPGHSFKFAAALQHAQAGDAPVLIRIETRAGHGAGKPTAKLIEEITDEWAFLVKNLHMTLPRE
jgi:prolyl oligopeptidase